MSERQYYILHREMLFYIMFGYVNDIVNILSLFSFRIILVLIPHRFLPFPTYLPLDTFRLNYK